MFWSVKKISHLTSSFQRDVAAYLYIPHSQNEFFLGLTVPDKNTYKSTELMKCSTL